MTLNYFSPSFVSPGQEWQVWLHVVLGTESRTLSVLSNHSIDGATLCLLSANFEGWIWHAPRAQVGLWYCVPPGSSLLLSTFLQSFVILSERSEVEVISQTLAHTWALLLLHINDKVADFETPGSWWPCSLTAVMTSWFALCWLTPLRRFGRLALSFLLLQTGCLYHPFFIFDVMRKLVRPV